MNSLAKIALIAIGASAKKLNPLDSISQWDGAINIINGLLKNYGDEGYGIKDNDESRDLIDYMGFID